MTRLLVFILSVGALYGQAAGGLTYLPPPGSGSSLITFSSNVVLSGGVTPIYVPLGGGGLGSTTEADVQDKVQPAGTISNLCVNLSAAPGMGNSVVFTLRDGGSNEVVTVTIANAATSGCDTTHSFGTTAGDLLDWSIVPSGTIMGYDPNVLITAQFGGLGSGSGGGATTNQNIRTIGAFFGSFQSGATALSGTLTACVPTYFSGTIQSVELIGDVVGSVTVDVLTVAHTSWTGTASASSITAAAIPALSSAARYTDSTLTGWTTSFAAGTDVCFAMTSPTTIAGVSIAVKIAAN
jgi:hypothetical protein